jgi:hypothetical protein
MSSTLKGTKNMLITSNCPLMIPKGYISSVRIRIAIFVAEKLAKNEKPRNFKLSIMIR